MGYKKPEKKSRLKDLKDLLEALPDRKEPKGIPFEFLTEPPEGMEHKPTKTMEFRDYNQNGIEDREEGLYLPRDFQPKKEEEDIPEWVKEARKEYMQRIFKAGGGMMNINDMTGPVGYAPGGEVDDFPFGKPGDPGFKGTDPTVDPLKDTRRPASASISTKKPYVMFLKDAGYTKNASIDDVKDYAKKLKIKIKVGQVIGSPSAFRNTLSALGVKEKTKQADNVLNQALKRAKKPLYVPGAKAAIDIGEELISVGTNT